MLRRNKKLLILPKKTIIEVKGPFLDEYVLVHPLPLHFAFIDCLSFWLIVGRRKLDIKTLNARCRTKLSGWKWKRGGSIRIISVCLVYFLSVLSPPVTTSDR